MGILLYHCPSLRPQKKTAKQLCISEVTKETRRIAEEEMLSVLTASFICYFATLCNAIK